MMHRHCVLAFAGLVTLSACSHNDNGSSESGAGGVSNVGGAKSPSTGGAAYGGAVASGGALSRGGSGASDSTDPAGGAVGSGGSISAANGGTGAATTFGGSTNSTGSSAKGGGVANGGTASGATARGGATTGDTNSKGGATSGGGVSAKGGASNAAGANSKGGATTSGASAKGGATTGGSITGGVSATGGSSNSSGTTSSAGNCSGPIGTFSGALATGINFTDTDGNRVNAHGGGIIKVGDTYYMHGEYFLSTTTDNNFNGFSMYSSKDMATWKNEGIILPQQPSGELGPVRKGERPHIIKCPATGEFVLYAHAADEKYQTDKEVVYATSATVNGQYAYKGALTNSEGTTAAHSDMSAFADGNNAYVLTESGHVYTLSSDCHSWLTDKYYSTLNGDSGGVESPTVFKAGSTYYWIGSYKTGWRANNNFYSTAPAMTGPWTFQDFIAPVADKADKLSDERTWLSQSTWVQPIEGCEGTTYVYWGDHWDGNLDATAQGKHNYLATYVFQPLVFDGIKISMPTYLASWKLDVGKGTWTN